MFFSRVRLNTNLRKTQLAMASPNIYHGAIERAFEDKQKRNLWRVDKLRGQYYLLILSKEKPNLEVIVSQFGYKGETGEIKIYDSLINRVDEKQTWRFRLVANPTYSVKCDEKKRGKVIAHTSIRHQLEWLGKKALQGGFEIEEANVVASEWKIFRKKDKGAKVRIKEATFEGVLTINDVEKFKKTLIKGIGRGKVYGMGLLTIVRE